MPAARPSASYCARGCRRAAWSLRGQGHRPFPPRAESIEECPVVQRKTSKPGRSPKPATTTPARATARKASPKPRVARVDLALQGGGAHGAFTWGVLDRLLEEPWLDYRRHLRHLRRRDERGGDGRRLSQGGRRGRARGAGGVLEARVGRPRASARSSAVRSKVLLGRWTLDYSPVFTVHGPDGARVLALRHSTRSAPTRCAQILADSVDFARLAAAPIKLFVTATNVRTGRAASSATPTSRRTCCWPPPACRRCSRRSRSTASPTGTAAIPATRR